ncbi:MAG: hypothetical protein WD749_07520 [Phycisphaerales bacterium]
MNAVLLGLVLVALAALQGPPAPAPPAAPPPTFEERLRQLDEKLGAVKDIRANFEQRKRTAMLKRPLVSRGEVRSRGASALWETTEPQPTSMLLTDTEIRVHYPADRLVEVYPLDDRLRDAAIGPVPRLAKLKERFAVAELDPATLGAEKGSPHFVALTLTPESGDLKRHIASVRVLIDERIPGATRIVVTDPDGDETDMVFTAVKLNSGVTEAEVALRLPEGTRVVRPLKDRPEKIGARAGGRGRRVRRLHVPWRPMGRSAAAVTFGRVSAPRGVVTAEPAPAVGPPGAPRWVLSVVGAEGGAAPIVAVPGGGPALCTVRAGRSASLATVELADAASLEPAAFGAAVAGMIGRALGALGGTAAPHPVRVWNFLPGIYDPMGGIDRYRAFNIARHRAYVAHFGGAAVRSGALPTATCIGHGGTGLAVHVLGAALPGEPVENPRQVPAYAYSARWGPRPPCFARSMIAGFEGRRLLLVGGTASVLGEDSAHPGSRAEQLEETLRNLDALIGCARRRVGAAAASGLAGAGAVRVYHKRAADRAWLARRLAGAVPAGTPTEWVKADICRDELLVEIEVVADLAAG